MEKQTPDAAYETIVAKSIEEINRYYQNLNDIVIETTLRYNKIFYAGTFDKSDYSFFKKNKVKYKKFVLSAEQQSLYNDDIVESIYQAAISSGLSEIVRFFDERDIDEWDKVMIKHRREIITPEQKYLSFAIQHINEFYAEAVILYKEFYAVNLYMKNEFEISNVVEKAYSIENPDKRKKYLADKIDAYINSIQTGVLKVDYNKRMYFIDRCNEIVAYSDNEIREKESQKKYNELMIEINKLEQTKEALVNSTNTIQSSEIVPDSTKISSIPEVDRTLNRQFLAIYYLLNAADKASFSRNKAEIARFVQFLTAKNYTNIYKLAIHPMKDPEEKSSTKYQNDLAFVKEFFIKLGLNDIAKQMDRDMKLG